MAGGSGKSAITGMRFSKIAVFADLDNCRHSKTARRLPSGLGSGIDVNDVLSLCSMFAAKTTRYRGSIHKY
jgi:hypothetical protein